MRRAKRVRPVHHKKVLASVVVTAALAVSVNMPALAAESTEHNKTEPIDPLTSQVEPKDGKESSPESSSTGTKSDVQPEEVASGTEVNSKTPVEIQESEPIEENENNDTAEETESGEAAEETENRETVEETEVGEVTEDNAADEKSEGGEPAEETEDSEAAGESKPVEKTEGSEPAEETEGGEGTGEN